MKRTPQTSLLVVFTALFFISGCVSRDAEKKLHESISYETIEKMLASGEGFEREEPFMIRKFNPDIKKGLLGNGISYGPYRDGQAPWGPGPSDEEILEDLRIIEKYWNVIRLYNTDDDTERIVRAIKDNGIKLEVMLGIWISKEEGVPEGKESNIRNILRCIRVANEYPDVVKAINVGNETQVFWSGHGVDQNALINYIRTVRKYTKVPVTTADDHMFWREPESESVAAEIDFIVAHVYALWNGKTLEESIPWTEETVNIIKKEHPERTVVLGETGWATKYDPDRKGDGEQGTLVKGEVGYEGQEQFLHKLDGWLKATGMTVFFFQVFDEPWKAGYEEGSDHIEKNWGVFYESREPKISFKNYLKKQETE